MLPTSSKKKKGYKDIASKTVLKVLTDFNKTIKALEHPTAR